MSTLGPKHWRARAEELRVISETVRDTEVEGIMLRIASEYERLAEAIERIQPPQYDISAPPRQLP